MFARFTALSLCASNEVNDDRDVEQKQDKATDAGMAQKLVDFDGDERAARNDDQPRPPPMPMMQRPPFNESE
jgi:hypothetical protein